jgi:hypothetical protein
MRNEAIKFANDLGLGADFIKYLRTCSRRDITRRMNSLRQLGWRS